MLPASQSLARIDDILAALGGMDDRSRAEALEVAGRATQGMLWVPNPGPQTDAFFSDADEIFFGGQAGGGKSDLEVGLALTSHHRSLILRRTNREALGLVERLAEIVGNRDGWAGQQGIWRIGERTIEIGGCQLEEDKQKYKGAPHDLICFDEVSDFSESQYTFICGWNRSAKPGQRCRIVAAGNPPTRPEGLWVMKRWAAWLDPRHPFPAQPGELRWYTTGKDGKEIEVDGAGPHDIGEEKPVTARSRTFIPSKLSDNPDLAETGYAATLAALPEELRAAYRDGAFHASLKDEPFQTIPTFWVQEAQRRWSPSSPQNVPMCCIGMDVAQGGKDQTVLAIRYDGWFAPLVAVPGSETPDGPSGAAVAIKHRRDGAHVVVDMGGGYGGGVLTHLRDNGVDVSGYKGSESAVGRTVDGQLGFTNKRTAAYWRLREALDPGQAGGSWIAFPPDPELVADLTAPLFEIRGGKICLESKEHVTSRLGRSTDKGDAVVMALSRGFTQANVKGGFLAHTRTPAIDRGYTAARRRR